MSDTSTKPDLLQACIHDLHAARRVAAERLPGIIGHAGEKLARLLGELKGDYAGQAKQLEGTDIPLDGPENLWMAGVMDDADRDSRSIVAGALLDTALIGAIRKGVMADAVSLETAVAVARSLDRDDIADLAEAMRGCADEHDARLRALLQEIT